MLFLFSFYCFVGFVMVKSHDIRDIVISHYKHGKKLVEVQLIVGYIVTSNLVQFVLNQIQEDQQLTVQK